MPDYNFIMDSRLRPEQLRVINQLGRVAASQGLILYLAGASARDLVLGLSSGRNLNFVVEGNVQKLLRPLTSRTAQRAEPPHPPGIPAHDQMDLKVADLTVDAKLNRAHVIFEGGVEAEIAGARNEVYTAPAKAPTLSLGTIFDDLRRRDFSIDAMALSLHPNSRGLLLDPTNGAADIERHELRALHSRSFFDDPARIYRLFRLSLRLDFKPDEKTERWLGMALEERVWEHVSDDQQGRELRAILGEDAAGKLIKLLKDRELLGGLDRKLASARIEFDKFERIRNAVRTANAPDDDAALLNFHALVTKLPASDQDWLAKKILKDARTVKAALALERDSNQLAKALTNPKMSKASQIYTLLASAPTTLVLFLLVYDTRPAIQHRIKAYFTKYLASRARLPRAELQSLGLPPGPKFERVMDQVFLDELDGKIKNPQQMTKLLMDYAGIKAPPPPPPPVPGKVGAGKAAKGQAAKAPVAKGGEPPKPAAPLAPPATEPAVAAAKPVTGKNVGAAQAAQAKPGPAKPAAAAPKPAETPKGSVRPPAAKASTDRPRTAPTAKVQTKSKAKPEPKPASKKAKPSVPAKKPSKPAKGGKKR
jgi:tRNA nucleotidyltransferase (CCA-adding enzyme)